MARLSVSLTDRVESFCDRVLDVVEALPPRRISGRIVEQIAASGTSVGANVFEADEALSRPDFCKRLGIVVKELNETRFWLRRISRRGWIKASRLDGLEGECNELRLIFGTMISRTRSKRRPNTKP